MTIIKPYRVSINDIKIKLLLFGDPGIGKTTFCAQANDYESTAPALFLNFEGGLLSVAERGDIDTLDINSMQDLSEVYEALVNNAEELQDYRTVILDSGSEMYQMSLTEATAKTVNRDMRRGKSERTVDETGLEDYGLASRMTYRLFRQFRDLPRNVIATAHAKYSFPRNADKRTTDPTEVVPAFSGQLTTQLMGVFDFVWYYYLDGETRSLLTQTAGAYKAKTRGVAFAQNLGMIVPDPNLADIMFLLRDGQALPEHANTFEGDEADSQPEAQDEGTEDLPEALPEPDNITPMDLTTKGGQKVKVASS